MIINSQKNAKKGPGKSYEPFPQSPLMLAFYTFYIQFNIKTKKLTLVQSLELIQFPSVIHALVYVCTHGCVYIAYITLSHVCVTTIPIKILKCTTITRPSHVTFLQSLHPFYSHPHPLAITNTFSNSMITFFHEHYSMKSCSRYPLEIGIFSLSMISLRFIQVVACSSFYLFIAELYFMIYMYRETLSFYFCMSCMVPGMWLELSVNYVKG